MSLLKLLRDCNRKACRYPKPLRNELSFQGLIKYAACLACILIAQSSAKPLVCLPMAENLMNRI